MRVILLDVMGGVALLLWGLHMVQSGIVRAFGAEIRHVLTVALRGRFKAFLAGVGVTALLQSSTAMALMVTSFSADGLLGLVPALALMLGANVGTALVVQVLSFNISAAAPVLLVAGVVAFKRGGRTRTRDLGRVSIGLGLMLLALHILLDSVAPAEQAPGLRTVLQVASGAPLLNVLVAALLTWAAHSSVAVVLLAMSLGYSGFATPAAGLALVLGANLGSAINPLIEAGSKGDPASRRVPLGNFINRVAGCALFLPFLDRIAAGFAGYVPDPVRLIAGFHLAFNLALAALFIVPLGPFARLLERVLPETGKPADPAAPLYLDPSAVDSPPLALACAARETLHMGDVVETMLQRALATLTTDDRNLVAEVSRMDDAVDRLHGAIKLYVVRVTRDSLDDREARRAMEIIAFAMNLEHIGDIVDMNLMELAAKKIKRKLRFSREGAEELEAMHRRVLEDLKLAFGIFISGDVKVARQLLDEKTRFREAEIAAAESHLARLREGRPESIETSGLHLDILRDLKRIHSHVCAAAYPVLEAAGELRASRLRSRSRERLAPARNGDPR
ncbi:MAG: Na/Pi cotransporter family protein [Betaproteobacteria bacterium]|nr:Na/Pi cotransporter family protein [Betaproteobacteria bacterium]